MGTTPQSRRISVRAARERAGLSQVQLAVRLSVSEPTYRKYEQHPDLMSLRTARRLTEILGVGFSDLALYETEAPQD